MLDNKAIVITGAGRGIGKEAALAVASYQALVVVNDIDGDEARSVVDEIERQGGRAVVSDHSVADADQARALIDLCVTTYGRIDGLVNNAGLVSTEDPWLALPEDIDRLVDVNVKGMFFVGTAALAKMQEQRSGVVVNLTSRTHAGAPSQALYASTKGAAASATYGWALDMAPYGVRVVAFSPLAVTRMWDQSASVAPTDNAPEASAVALGIPYLLSDRAKKLSGQVLRFDGKKLSLMKLPRYDDPLVERASFTVDDIADVIDNELADHICPVGVARLDLTHVGWS
ncbi:SDR family oxidoreductase [soil metagenome]